jgi:hypothetical protein
MSAPIRIDLSVLAEDIHRGVIRQPRNCPFAKALARLGFRASVFNNEVRIHDSSIGIDGRFRTSHTMFALTADARNWIEKFDHGMPVEPCTFTLTREPTPVTPPSFGWPMSVFCEGSPS